MKTTVLNETKLWSNDLIYIDTCSLMQYAVLDKILTEARPILLEKNKKIIVPKSVYLELLKHQICNDANRQQLAEQAWGLVKKYNDVFVLEDTEASKKEIYQAFADADLISKMTVNKTHFSQLLITNDKKLSMDAININTMKSCRGKRVQVYSISESGILEEFTAPAPEQPKVIIKEVKKKEQPLKEFARALYLISTGVLLGVGGKHVYKYAKNIDWRNVYVNF